MVLISRFFFINLLESSSSLILKFILFFSYFINISLVDLITLSFLNLINIFYLRLINVSSLLD